MNELNDKELEQVVGGTHAVPLDTLVEQPAAFWWQQECNEQHEVTSTILPPAFRQPHQIIQAKGYGSHAAGGASSFAGGATGTH